MRTLIFDPLCGASGDMIMGCLLDLGANRSQVSEAVESVGCKLEITDTTRGHIKAKKALVKADKRFKTLEEAMAILDGSSLDEKWTAKTHTILKKIADAEGVVHGHTVSHVRFHEIGAMDALADIAGCCAAMSSLNVDRVLSLQISVGGGSVNTAHGLLPVPAPATLEILKQAKVSWRGGPVDKELLTPTGAAILTTLADEFIHTVPSVDTIAIGYGAGTMELETPNIIRGMICRTLDRSMQDEVVQLESNTDDVTGEVIGHLIDVLMKQGALDVSVMPAVMKKGRSGNIISVVAKKEDMGSLAKTMMTETGSLGIRISPLLHRIVAKREDETVFVNIGGKSHSIRVKVAHLGEELLNVKPEYDDCERVAREMGMPLREVTRIAEAEGRRIFK